MHRLSPHTTITTYEVLTMYTRCPHCGREYGSTYAAHVGIWYGVDPLHTPDHAPYLPYAGRIGKVAQ